MGKLTSLAAVAGSAYARLVQPPDPTPPSPAPSAPEPEPTDDVAALHRENAKWRRQVRETEAERDALRARVDLTDRREIERMAEEKFTDPSDVWGVIDLDTLRGDDGLLNLDAAQQKLTELERTKPHWLKQQEPEPEPGPTIPQVANGARPTPETPKPISFGQELRRARYE